MIAYKSTTQKTGWFTGTAKELKLFYKRDMLPHLPDRVTKLEQEMESLRERIKASKAGISDLKLTSEGVISIRNRHLDVYRRDIGGEPNIPKRLIRKKNAVAHNDNAASDALLYEKRIRTDYPTYQRKYGINPFLALALRTIDQDCTHTRRLTLL
jgi:hypothetical protein